MIKQILSEEFCRMQKLAGIIKEEISVRLIQGGALTNPPKKLYHGTGYKISYDELNMHEHRSKDGKGFNHTAKGSGYIGVYFYEEKNIGLDIVGTIGDINLTTSKSISTIKYAEKAADGLKSEFAYIYEAEISDDAAILSVEKFPGNVGGVREKDLDQYVDGTQIKVREFDGSGPDLAEFVIWNKDVIKSWNIKYIAVENPYSGVVDYEKWRDEELKKSWIDTLGTTSAHYLNLVDYLWFTDIEKANYFLENYKKNKSNKLEWLLTYKNK